MASTYTANGLTKQGVNDNPNTWGTILNDQVIELIEEMVNGVTQVNVTGSSDVTITTTNGVSSSARHAVLEIVGTISSNITLNVPSTEHIYLIRSTHTGGNVSVKPAGSSTSLTIPDGGGKYLVYINGTDIHNMYVEPDFSPYAQKGNNLSDLTDIPTARSNLGLGDAATTSVLDILTSVYPVGSLYISSSSTNPNTLFGFGTWEVYSQGRVLLGAGSGTDINGTVRSFNSGDTGGEYTHTQTVSEMRKHFHHMAANISSVTGSAQPDHSIAVQGGAPGWANSEYSLSGMDYATYPPTNGKTSEVGGSEPMPWMQPYLAVHIWRRTA